MYKKIYHEHLPALHNCCPPFTGAQSKLDVHIAFGPPGVAEHTLFTQYDTSSFVKLLHELYLLHILCGLLGSDAKQKHGAPIADVPHVPFAQYGASLEQYPGIDTLDILLYKQTSSLLAHKPAIQLFDAQSDDAIHTSICRPGAQVHLLLTQYAPELHDDISSHISGP